jgi:hypothetical protein
MIKFFLIICSLTFAVNAQAQFTDSITHFVRFNATGNINRTNRGSAYLLNNEGRFSLKKKSTVLNAFAGWVYGTQNERLSNNDVTTTVDFNLYRDSSHLYYWGLANYTSSYSLRIRNQLQSGLGVAYNIANTTAFWLNVSNGILYETSSLKTSANGHESYNTFRNSFRLSFRLAVKNFSLNGVHFLQNSLRYRQDYIIRSTTGIEVKVNKWISINTSLLYNQFRRTGSETLLFTYGLAAQRYF